MPNLHLEVLPPKQHQLWQQFQSSFEIPNQLGFYLAGGTALALEVGHRQSIDFDFFSQSARIAEPISNWLQQRFQNFLLRETDIDTVHVEIDGVKVSFIGYYKYPLVTEETRSGHLRLASILDIALMKLLAITHRATLRDYLDLAVIIRDHIPLKTLLEKSSAKYGEHFNVMILLKALAAFQDVDMEKPVLLDKTLESSWQDILTQAVKEISR